METSPIPVKTDLARQALQRRDSLPHAHRLFLIMVDGRKSLRELAPAAQGLGVDGDVLAAFVDQGLMAWQASAPAPRRAASPAGPAAARRASAGNGAPSLAAAKMYAMDLAALMLPNRDRELRDAARRATDVHEMRTWLKAAAGLIAAHAGEDRAALFLDKVAALMPRDALPLAAAES